MVTQQKRGTLRRALLPFPSPPGTILAPCYCLTVQAKVIGLYCPALVGTLCMGGMPAQCSSERLYGVGKEKVPGKPLYRLQRRASGCRGPCSGLRSGRAAHEVQPGHQPQGCPGHGAEHSAGTPVPGGQGDPVGVRGTPG